MCVTFYTGFGGKYGVQADRMDKSAVGHDYVGKVEKHVSQTDYAQGFGGKYGVQTDRVDKVSLSYPLYLFKTLFMKSVSFIKSVLNKNTYITKIKWSHRNLLWQHIMGMFTLYCDMALLHG